MNQGWAQHTSPAQYCGFSNLIAAQRPKEATSLFPAIPAALALSHQVNSR